MLDMRKIRNVSIAKQIGLISFAFQGPPVLHSDRLPVEGVDWAAFGENVNRTEKYGSMSSCFADTSEDFLNKMLSFN